MLIYRFTVLTCIKTIIIIIITITVIIIICMSSCPFLKCIFGEVLLHQNQFTLPLTTVLRATSFRFLIKV